LSEGRASGGRESDVIVVFFQKLTSAPLPNTLSMAPRDFCSGVRKAYDAIVRALASNNIVAALLTGVPFYYLYSVGFAATRSAVAYYTSAVWVFSAILTIAWILGIVAMWKMMPNLLTVTIMVYRAFGYWCLVSSFLVISYALPYLPAGLLGYVLAAILPSILFLLVCGDVLRAVRTRLYATIALAAGAATGASAATATSAGTVDSTPFGTPVSTPIPNV